MIAESFAHMWRNPSRRWWWRPLVLLAGVLALCLVPVVWFCVVVTEDDRKGKAS